MKTIIWDVDDTLNDFKYHWLLYEKSRNKINQNIYYHDLRDDIPYQVLQNNKEYYLKSLDDFRKDKYIINVIPNKDILNWFVKYGDKFNNIILTATSIYCFSISVDWVQYYFKKWIRIYCVVPSKRNNDNIDNYESKKEFIERNFNNIDFFIDDSEKNCKEVSELNIKTFCPKQPWNNGQSINEILEELKKNI